MNSLTGQLLHNRQTVYALLGSPITHSLSPAIFNGAFQKLSYNSVYLPFEVPADRLRDAVTATKSLGFGGFNVTIPHKVRIIPYLDFVDNEAKEIGAVNVVVNDRERGLVGFNTDGEGAFLAIRSAGFDPEDSHIVVIGAGGSARAIVHRISTEAKTITVLNRTPIKAGQKFEDNSLGKTMYDRLTRLNFEKSLHNANLLVNATPIQTTELLNLLNLPTTVLKQVDWLFDLSYDHPGQHVPTKHGRISPLEMLLQQAGLTYELWFGKPVPLDLMRNAMMSHLVDELR